MPATALYSSTLNNAPKKVLVSTSDANEESTGIVRVGVQYVAKSADAEAVSQSMVLDSEPPEYPNTVFRNQLERGRLYQYQRTLEQEYGVAKIRAFYVGVLKRGQEPQLRSDTETFSATFPLGFEDIGRATGVYNAENLFATTFPALYEAGRSNTRTNAANAVAGVSVSGVSIRLQRRLGAIVSGNSRPGGFSATLEQLLVSATVSINVPGVFEQWLLNLFGVSTIGTGPTGGLFTTPVGPANQRLENLFTPLKWMELFSNRLSITNSVSVDYITPTVGVLSGDARLEVFSAPVFIFPTVAPTT
jgi:hypothetical protein